MEKKMANTEKKITKKDRYNRLYAIVEQSNATDKVDLLGFIDHEVELLEKKSSKTTLTANQKANLEIIEVIKEVLADKPNSTVSEMIKDDRLAAYSNQKISSLLTKLGDDGTKEVVKITDKKVSRFSLREAN